MRYESSTAFRRALEDRLRQQAVTCGTSLARLRKPAPLADHILRQGGPADRTVALIIYPMNALVTSQVPGLEALKAGYEQRTGRPCPLPATPARPAKKHDRVLPPRGVAAADLFGRS